MPDHTSWFTYLLSLPNFRALWALFNHTGCINEAHEVVAMEGGRCPAGAHVAELPNHLTYPAHTPVTLEYTTLLLFVFGLIVVFTLVTRARLANTEAAKIPEGRLTIASFTENFVEAFYNMLKDALGARDAKYFLPIIGTCALLIFFSNALGLIPGFSPPTSNFNVTLACGLIIFFSTHLYGLRRNGVAYLQHFIGPVWWLFWLMLPLEVISHLVRPISLAIRLCVNLFVDHLVVSVFTGLVFIFIPVPVMILGVLVVVLQTYVFCLLATIYIQLAIEHHEEHATDHGHEGHGAPHDPHQHMEEAPIA